jgi:hypothetical protein
MIAANRIKWLSPDNALARLINSERHYVVILFEQGEPTEILYSKADYADAKRSADMFIDMLDEAGGADGLEALVLEVVAVAILAFSFAGCSRGPTYAEAVQICTAELQELDRLENPNLTQNSGNKRKLNGTFQRAD